MTWAKIDDGFLDHPKVLRAGEDAANLHLRAIVWCSKHLTDGEVPREALGALTRRSDAETLAATLARVGLWEQTEDGWRVHNFTEHNPTRAEVEARRDALSAKRREAGRVGGLRSGIVRAESVEATKQTGSKPEANGKQTAKQGASTDRSKHEAPSRPVPSRQEEGGPSSCAGAPARERAGQDTGPPDGERADSADPLHATGVYAVPRGGLVAALQGTGTGEGRADGGEAPDGATERPGEAVRCPAREAMPSGRVVAADVLVALRSEGRVRLTVTSPQEVELDRVMADLAARGEGWTREGLSRLGAHLRAGHQGEGREGGLWRPTMDYLRGRDGSWTGLTTQYDRAHACPACDAAERGAVVLPIRPLLDAFLAGAGGQIPAVPASSSVATDAERMLSAAGMTPDTARRAGVLAVTPARWSRSPRITNAGRAPTLQDLLGFGGEAMSELLGRVKANDARPASAPVVVPPRARISNAEAMAILNARDAEARKAVPS